MFTKGKKTDLLTSAMGKSRSATILIAYLLWITRQQAKASVPSKTSEDMVPLPPKGLSVVEALELLRQGRAICEPNEGFMDQLHMFENMGCPTTESELKSHKLYQRWMNKRKVEESLRTMQAPEMENIIFEDEADDHNTTSNDTSHMQEVAQGVFAPDGKQQNKRLAHPNSANSPEVTIKCRKCRQIIATTPFILDHSPPPHRDPSTEQPAHLKGTPLPPAVCAHIFLHPLSWMREVLSEGKMEGRLSCPNKKCGTNIGKFAWTGSRCSCGGWVTPGFGIIRTKVDEVVQRSPDSSTRGSDHTSSQASSAAAGIRLPPGMKRQGNL